MKIAWFCIPAHGHTNPTLGLVKELTGRGHEIYYFSFEQFREKIENAGATFISCDGYDFEMEDKDNSDRVGKDQAFAVELLVNSVLSLDEMVTEKIESLKPDIIVADSIAYWGKLAAMKFGIPFVSSTTTFAFNRYSSRYMKHGIGETLKMLFSMPKINKQINRLKDKGYPIKGLLDIVQNDNETNTIVYTSKYFQPCSETFSERYHFIGPSMRPITNEFEKKGEKTVYISMGTVNKNQEFYRNCIDAFGGTDYQVIISLGRNPEHFDNVPDNIELYDSVDQMAVLAISDVFFTHCGMNSTSESLYYGVPLVLFPQNPEQDAVAKRTEELGAGLRLPSLDKSDILGSARRLVEEPGFLEGAKKISESFKTAGGVKEAADFIQDVVHSA